MNTQLPDFESPFAVQEQMRALGQLGSNVSVGWWAIFTVVVQLWHGHFWSWTTLLMIVPGEFVSFFVPMPITAVFCLVLIAADKLSLRGGNVFGVISIVYAITIVAANLALVVWIIGLLRPLLG